MHNSISTAAQAIVSFTSGSSSIDELKDILNREFSPVRSGNENDILWDRRIEAKGWIIEAISFLNKEQLEEVEIIVLKIANKENLNNITIMEATSNKQQAYRIQVSTNDWQASRDPLFKRHTNTALLTDVFITKEDAIEELKQIALRKVGDDYLVYESEADALGSLISDHCYDAKINEKEWIEAHPRLIKFLADKYRYSSPGIYLNFNILNIRDSSKPGCEFEFGSEYFSYDAYNYEIIEE